MSYSIQNLIDDYKHKVQHFGVLSAEELAELLEKKVPAVRLDYGGSLGESISNSVKIMITGHEKFKNSNLRFEDLEFISYKILNSGKGEDYYKCPFFPETFGDKSEGIYVVFEKKLNWILCNNNKLFLELHIERGVDISDYNNNTIELAIYLANLQAYEEERYIKAPKIQ